ncbi:DinB family protein [Fictibacillus barbaricus]|uniref:DinB family protein n=1 Tax=Fictibacillus barbaricus TaxID=182136 RepID=A0ABS2ZET5_9BACL|nr:DinB family protein [Fictibacillus barbaricus]MBN3545111.1 DinB family protein [Fictibacillus barbaricus]GGB61626.1 formate dehydrogenase [Fictibacillus barbaricus]
MNEKMIFDQLEFARNITFKVAEGITEENADLIPDGFPNSLRWQLGHIYTSVEGIVFHFANETKNLPRNYGELFNTGTKPVDWNTTPPTIEEIKSLLSEQVKRVRETFEGRLDEKIANPLPIGPLKLETIGELISFASFHESEHIGIIKTMNHAVKSSVGTK